MRIRNITSDNDWCFGHSKSDYVRNAYAVAKDIKMKLLEWTDDCFFALTNGIAWKIRLGYKNQKELLDNDIIRVARSVEGVLNITDFVSALDNRRYSAKFNVFTQYSNDAIPIEFNTGDFING